jgi:hypothetical protein
MKKYYLDYKKYYEEKGNNAFLNKTIEFGSGIKQKSDHIINII